MQIKSAYSNWTFVPFPAGRRALHPGHDAADRPAARAAVRGPRRAAQVRLGRLCRRRRRRRGGRLGARHGRAEAHGQRGREDAPPAHRLHPIKGPCLNRYGRGKFF